MKLNKNWLITSFSMILFGLISVSIAQAANNHVFVTVLYNDNCPRQGAIVKIYDRQPTPQLMGLCNDPSYTNASGQCNATGMTLSPGTVYKAIAYYPPPNTYWYEMLFQTDGNGNGQVTIKSSSNLCPSGQQCCSETQCHVAGDRPFCNKAGETFFRDKDNTACIYEDRDTVCRTDELGGEIGCTADKLCNGRDPYIISGIGIGRDDLCYTNCSYYKCDVSHCGVTLSFYDPRNPYVPPQNMRCVYNCVDGPCGSSCPYYPYHTSWVWVWGGPDVNCVPTNLCCNDNGCTAYACNTGTYRCRTTCSSPSDCKTGYTCVGSACVPASCSGPISLSLSPSTAWTGQTVTATVSGLSNCNGKRVYVGVGQYDILRCWCTVSGSGCSCTFTAPSNGVSIPSGTMDYHAKIDMNGNGNYNDAGEKADATLTINCDTKGHSCNNHPGVSSPNTCCGGSYYCTGTPGVCKLGRGGGCPTLFVYDGKDYVKERKSNIHSQPGIDTVDDITLTTKPVVVNGNYLLQLKETTLPEHSHLDSVKLYVTDSEGKKEAKLLSAKHSKYGDVTAALAKSDDVRTDTQVFDTIDLKFKVPELKGEANFTFEIEGYNPAVNILDKGVSILGQVITGNMITKFDIADFSINKVFLIIVGIVISIVFIVVIFAVFKVTMKSNNILIFSQVCFNYSLLPNSFY